MNQEIKAKWVAALRSGEYKQTKDVLQSSSGYCCLGVLCDIHEKETGFSIVDNLRETIDDEHLGHTVQQWAGLGFEYGAHVFISHDNRPLTAHNDSGKTFLQIADAIEEQL